MNNYYVKTMLYAYPNIEAIMEQIDELVERKALLSMFDFSPATEQCRKVLSLTDEKDTLIDLKIVMDKVVKNLNDYEMKCVEYKYFKRQKKEYYKDFDTQSRQYFRYQLKVVDKVGTLIEKGGINDDWFVENCLSMDFFKELLKRVIIHEKLNNKNKPKKVKIERQNKLQPEMITTKNPLDDKDTEKLKNKGNIQVKTDKLTA